MQQVQITNFLGETTLFADPMGRITLFNQLHVCLSQFLWIQVPAVMGEHCFCPSTWLSSFQLPSNNNPQKFKHNPLSNGLSLSRAVFRNAVNGSIFNGDQKQHQFRSKSIIVSDCSNCCLISSHKPPAVQWKQRKRKTVGINKILNLNKTGLLENVLIFAVV